MVFNVFFSRFFTSKRALRSPRLVDCEQSVFFENLGSGTLDSTILYLVMFGLRSRYILDILLDGNATVEPKFCAVDFSEDFQRCSKKFPKDIRTFPNYFRIVSEE